MISSVQGMSVIGIFLDIKTLHFKALKTFHRKLNYELLNNKIKQLGEVGVAIAYGTQFKHEATHFISFLKKLGYECKWKEIEQEGDLIIKPNLGVDIAIDCIKALPKINNYIMATSDVDLIPLFQYLKDQGKIVTHMSPRRIPVLFNIADEFIGIGEECLGDT